MGKLDGKVAFITGAARGQGRAHAVRLAREGADIIALDLCRQLEIVSYPLARPEDLAQTRQLVEALGRKIVVSECDVRDRPGLQGALDAAVAQLGRCDIVIANAGIVVGASPPKDEQAAFRDLLDINLVGVWNTVEVALPTMLERDEGGSVVLISSTAGLRGGVSGSGGGTMGYAAAKHGVVGLMRKYANLLAHRGIRVNSVHPTGVNSPMNVTFHGEFADFISRQPAEIGRRWTQSLQNPMPVGEIDAMDVANAVAWLVSDDARYVTGITLPVDAGLTNS